MAVFREGTVFGVPLRDRGYGRGIVVRGRADGAAVFGYFFGPRVSAVARLGFKQVEPERSILRVRFSGRGIKLGTWPIVGQLPHWDRVDWPVLGIASDSLAFYGWVELRLTKLVGRRT